MRGGLTHACIHKSLLSPGPNFGKDGWKNSFVEGRPLIFGSWRLPPNKKQKRFLLCWQNKLNNKQLKFDQFLVCCKKTMKEGLLSVLYMLQKPDETPRATKVECSTFWNKKKKRILSSSKSQAKQQENSKRYLRMNPCFAGWQLKTWFPCWDSSLFELCPKYSAVKTKSIFSKNLPCREHEAAACKCISDESGDMKPLLRHDIDDLKCTTKSGSQLCFCILCYAWVRKILSSTDIILKKIKNEYHYQFVTILIRTNIHLVILLRIVCDYLFWTMEVLFWTSFERSFRGSAVT